MQRNENAVNRTERVHHPLPEMIGRAIKDESTREVDVVDAGYRVTRDENDVVRVQRKLDMDPPDGAVESAETGLDTPVHIERRVDRETNRAWLEIARIAPPDDGWESELTDLLSGPVAGGITDD